MKLLSDLIQALNTNVIWGTPMVVLILATGIFLTIITKGLLFRHSDIITTYTIKSLFQKNPLYKDGTTPFQAVCTALAATVGTGNIVGVALAVSTGGPGALFWMWISSLVGMVIKYSEVTLSVAYRVKKHHGKTTGGPMYYIENGCGAKWLAIVFATFACIASFGIGAGVQSHALTNSLYSSSHVPSWISGAVVTLLTALVLSGGVRRISSTVEILVPFMSLLYIGGALLVLVQNITEIPHAFADIFCHAFTGTAATGGFVGAGVQHACRIGISRGVFTHEAGMGSAPIAHAPAHTDHPARQGLWGVFEVFFDSLVMCTITGLVILTSGLWYAEPKIPETSLCAAAFEQSFSGGQYLVTVCLVLFAFATVIAWYYYGEKCVEYIFPKHRTAVGIYRFIYIGTVFTASLLRLDFVWAFTDLFNGLMALPNLIALFVLSPVIRRLTDNFFKDPHRLRADDENFSRFLLLKKR